MQFHLMYTLLSMSVDALTYLVGLLCRLVLIIARLVVLQIDREACMQ